MAVRLSHKQIRKISLDDMLRMCVKLRGNRLDKKGLLYKKHVEMEKRLEFLISISTKAAVTEPVLIKCKACGREMRCTRRIKGGSIDYWGRDRHYVETCPKGPRIKPLPKGSAECSICGFKGTRGQVYTHRHNEQH